MTSPESKPATKGSRGKTIGITLAVLLVLGAGAFAIVRGGFFASEPPRPADPFEGTPAAEFSSGEDALVLPAPTEVPGFTVEQVGAALHTVKSALVAGRLDTAMLYDHDRTTFDALFSDYGVDLLDQLEQTNTFTIVATKIAEGHTLADDPVRFKGDTTFDGKTLENGIRVLVVHTSFVWVYPFSGELQRSGDHLVTLRDKVDWIFPEEAEVDPEYVGMYVGDASQYVASGIDCALISQGLVALGDPVEVDPDVADADTVFDPASDWTIPDELACTA